MEYTLKPYYYPIELSDEENGLNTAFKPSKKNITKRGNNIDIFFENPKKKKKTSFSSCIGHSNKDGMSYISTNEDDSTNSTHLVKIEVYNMKSLRDIPPTEYWKHVDVRVKYFAKSEDDKHYQHTRDLIFQITKQLAAKNDCKKYFIETDNKKA